MSERLALPTPEDVAALPMTEKAALRGQLLALLAASLTEPVPATDPALTYKEAAVVLGRGEDWVRRASPGWHDTLVAEFGIGFLMQPVANGDVRYSLAGLELLKRYWRGERAGRASASLTAGRRNG